MVGPVPYVNFGVQRGRGRSLLLQDVLGEAVWDGPRWAPEWFAALGVRLFGKRFGVGKKGAPKLLPFENSRVKGGKPESRETDRE